MDFIDKKEKLADLIEAFAQDPEKREELMAYLEEISEDSDFKSKPLFAGICDELRTHLDELSRREVKQRALMIRSYMD